MEHLFTQSTPSNYFTPKKRAQSNDKFYSDKAQKSTAQKFYDLEDSFKQYEHLLEENLYLKGLLLKQNFTTKIINNKQINFTPHYQNQGQNNEFDRKCHKNSSSTKCLSTNAYNQSGSMSFQDDLSNQNQIIEHDMVMWSIKHRNTYLEEKLKGLHNQYSKQTKVINKVVNSQKWKNRFDCKQSSCYQDKYMKLLRVKSPVLLE